MSARVPIPLLTWRAIWMIAPLFLVAFCWWAEWAPELFGQTRALLWVGWTLLAIGSFGRAFTPGFPYPGRVAGCLVVPAVWAAWRVSGDRWQIVVLVVAALAVFHALARWIAIEKSPARAAAYLGCVFAVGALPPWIDTMRIELAGASGQLLSAASPFALILQVHRSGDPDLSLTAGQEIAVIAWAALGLLVILIATRRREVVTAIVLVVAGSTPAMAQPPVKVDLLENGWARDGELVWIALDLQGPSNPVEIDVLVRSSRDRSCRRAITLGAGEARRVVLPVPVWRELPWIEVEVDGEVVERFDLQFVPEDLRLGAVLRDPTSEPEPAELEAILEGAVVIRIQGDAWPLDQPMLDAFDFVVIDGAGRWDHTEAVQRFVRLGGSLVRFGESAATELPNDAGRGRRMSLDVARSDPGLLARRWRIPPSGDWLRLAHAPRWGHFDWGLGILLGSLILGVCTFGLGRRATALAVAISVLSIGTLELVVFRRAAVSVMSFSVADLEPNTSYGSVEDCLALSRRSAGEVFLEFVGDTPPIRVPFTREGFSKLEERIEWRSDGKGGRVVARLPSEATAMWTRRRLAQWPGALEWRDGAVRFQLDPKLIWRDVRVLREEGADPEAVRAELTFAERWVLPLPSGRSVDLQQSFTDREHRELAQWILTPRVLRAEGSSSRRWALTAFSAPEPAWPGFDADRYQSVSALETAWLIRLR